MIKIKINNEDIQFPTDWEDLTFRQYIEMWTEQAGANDHTAVLSILAGCDLRTADVVNGLDKLITASAFINRPSEFQKSYDMIGPFKIPANSKDGWDIRFESLGQFEDMRAVFNKIKEDLFDHTKVYSRYVAIYLQKLRDKEYDPMKVDAMEAEVMGYPAGQVIALGGFFFAKLYVSLRGIKLTSLNTAPSPKKSKPVSRNSRRSLAITPQSRKSRRR